MFENYSFVKGKFVSGDITLDILQLEKVEIENLSFDRIRKILKKMDKREDKGFSSLMLAVNGYDHIPKELFEIDETRKYLKRLVQQFPHILFYLSTINQMHMQILASLSDFKKYYEGPISPKAYSEGSHQIEIILPKEVKEKLIVSIKKHANKVKPLNMDNELHAIYNFINLL